MLAAAHEDCVAYGTVPGSPEFRQCMMARNGQIEQQEFQRRQAVAQGLRDMGRTMNPPTTTCTTGRDAYGQIVTRCQ